MGSSYDLPSLRESNGSVIRGRGSFAAGLIFVGRKTSASVTFWLS